MTLSIGLVYCQKVHNVYLTFCVVVLFGCRLAGINFLSVLFRFGGLYFASRILAIWSVLSETNSSSSTWNASSRVHMGGFMSIVTSFQVIVFELKLMSTSGIGRGPPSAHHPCGHRGHHDDQREAAQCKKRPTLRTATKGPPLGRPCGCQPIAHGDCLEQYCGACQQG